MKNKKIVASCITIIIAIIAIIIILLLRNYFGINKYEILPPIPLESNLTADCASLDLKSALLFKSVDGIVGYVYFNKVYDNCAEYSVVSLKNSEIAGKGKYDITEKTHGDLKMGKSQLIRLGHISLLWQYPTNLSAIDNIKYLALIPVADAALLDGEKLEQIKWDSVKFSDR